MRDVLISVALVLAVALPAAAETRALSGFTAISASEGIQLEVSQGDFAVEVSGRDADKIVTTVSNGRLNVTRRGFLHFGPGPNARVHVTLPRLTALNASSGVEIVAGRLQSDRLAITLAQGATLDASDLNVTNLTLSATQGASADLSGECGALSVRAAMGGEITADNLRCASAVANASMGGAVDIRAEQSIEANASMGGMIDVSGQPAQRRTSAGMGGAVDFN